MRVPIDELEFTSDHIYTYKGSPFTGVGTEIDDTGRLVSEIPIEKGREHGIARSHFTSGALQYEATYCHGNMHGFARTWFEDGQLQEETRFEFGIGMERTVWSEAGEVIERFVREPDDGLALLARQRRAKALGLVVHGQSDPPV